MLKALGVYDLLLNNLHPICAFLITACFERELPCVAFDLKNELQSAEGNWLSKYVSQTQLYFTYGSLLT